MILPSAVVGGKERATGDVPALTLVDIPSVAADAAALAASAAATQALCGGAGLRTELWPRGSPPAVSIGLLLPDLRGTQPAP